MKLGAVIRGYHVVSEPTNDGGGKCVWAFAVRGGRHYFIKRFLEPKRPKEGSTASAASKAARLRECAEFEQRQRDIMGRLSHDVTGAGNLVLAVDFFHEGTTYYKVTERITPSPLDAPHALPPRNKSVLLKTLGLSVGLLHGIGVVHGDLKPSNVLIQRKGPRAFHTAKLIDFDDSYVSGQPPGPETITGDSVYGAPEWRRYVQGDPEALPGHLTTSVDVFALGLMAHRYLTGAIPGFDDRYDSPADAVIAGERLRVDERLAPHVRALLEAMTSLHPGARPPISAFLATLGDPEACVLHARPPAGRTDAVPPPAPRPGSRVRINLGDGRR
ncbi:lipopolysaccharide kinase InaA family protein [Sphaerisporangium sp. NPDC051011]|uniref:protein kinase domain-containing protein n=1 Tax=Sphaerisporangium sp. NPDC051011 TaxID=3155792 RepID=UPI0033C55EE1